MIPVKQRSMRICGGGVLDQVRGRDMLREDLECHDVFALEILFHQVSERSEFNFPANHVRHCEVRNTWD